MKIPAFLFALVLLPLAVRAQGTIRATTVMLPDGSTLTKITNPDTRTREATITQANGKVVSRTLYALNAQNFETGATHYDGKGTVRYKEIYTFDYLGRITEKKFFSGTNQPLGRRVYINGEKNQARVEDYDAAGNLISKSGQPGAGKSGTPDARRAVPVR